MSLLEVGMGGRLLFVGASQQKPARLSSQLPGDHMNHRRQNARRLARQKEK